MAPYDVLVVGAGPAGMAVATTLHKLGVEVRIVEEQGYPGGQIYRSAPGTVWPEKLRRDWLGRDYANGTLRVRECLESGVPFSGGISVWAIEPGDQDAVVRVGLTNGVAAETVRARHLVLATGAMERPTPFPGWTLPGVMGVGAAQSLMKSTGMVPEGRVVIAGTGPLVYLFACQLSRAGAAPAMILDTANRGLPRERWSRFLRALRHQGAALARGARWLAEIRRAGIRHRWSIPWYRANGSASLESVSFGKENGFDTEETDLLLVHDGVVPGKHLTLLAGCEHRWHPARACWEPLTDSNGESSRRGIFVVGDAAGIGGADVAWRRGQNLGWFLAHRMGRIDRDRLQRETRRNRRLNKGTEALRSFLDLQYGPAPFMRIPESETIVCRCEEITAGEIIKVAALGCTGPNQTKAFTRCGMGPCMGRECADTVSRILADFHGLPMDKVGTYGIRPPVKPITVGQLADLAE